MRPFSVKPRINKINGQINVSLPKRKLPKAFLNDLDKLNSVKLKLEGWD